VVAVNGKRVLIATFIGVLAGIFCAYGTLMVGGQLNFTVTTAILASAFYQRVLIGFVVGIADGIKLKPILRGALMGIVVGMAMSIIPLVDADIGGALTLLGFSMVYGIIADVVATKLTE
jgi:hypothetical protein